MGYNYFTYELQQVRTGFLKPYKALQTPRKTLENLSYKTFPRKRCKTDLSLSGKVQDVPRLPTNAHPVDARKVAVITSGSRFTALHTKL